MHIALIAFPQRWYYARECTAISGRRSIYIIPPPPKKKEDILGSIHIFIHFFLVHSGASHVIVTSYVFRDGGISMENLENLVDTVGKSRLVEHFAFSFLSTFFSPVLPLLIFKL